MKQLIMVLLVLFVAGLSAQVVLDPRYHTYEEIIQEISELQTNHPDIVSVHVIGSTLGADPYQDPIPIYAVKLSNNVGIDEDEPAVMYAGQCHAEEILGVEITMYMIQEIVANRMLDPYNVWLDNLEMWFVPTYNPEGLQVVMDGWDLTYRKNKRDYENNGVFDYEVGAGGDIDGVDPNRNYGFNWIHGDKWGVGGPEEWNDYYRGPAPFSEGGTQAIRNLAEQQHFIYSINWHSSRTGNFSQKVYYPSNWASVKPTPDLDLSQTIGENVADLIMKEDNSGSYEPYASSGRKGNAHDWFYKAHGTIQLLIECGTENLQPNNDPPEYLVDDTCERCSIGAYWLLDRALGYNAPGAMLTGHITDANSGNPLVAEVIIEEVDASYFDPRNSDELYGRYWRPLLPGTYTMRVVKKGYEEQLVESITVNSSMWKTEDVQLTPIPESIVSGTVNSNGNPIDATIILDNGEYFSADTINVVNGNFDFTNYEGEHQVIIYAENCVPFKQLINFPAGIYDLNIDLLEAVEVFEENWEGDLSNWTILGDWAITDSSIIGDYSVTDSPDEFYENGSTATIATTNPINMNSVSNDVCLTFWHKYYVEHDFDNCVVEYSFNGSNWTELAQFSGVSDNWVQEFIFVPEFVDHYVYLRFKVEADEILDDPGWWIDDIKIIASTGAFIDNNIPVFNSELIGNYPNPFNPETLISFSIVQTSSFVNLEIFNVKGQKVKTLVNEQLSSGFYTRVWDGKNDAGRSVTSGIYFYKMQNADYTKTMKMILLK
ncbi:MAG: T9SS type A sorting domain-containing protein [Candidatus Cloacimonetes bacterium]|nr:T9SS type A sorting domain-containing protein [Candidatus Cloacimonadota bacterium]